MSLVERSVVDRIGASTLLDDAPLDEVMWGASTYPVRAIELDISFLRRPADPAPTDFVLLRARFAVWDVTEAPLILGQHDVLERLQFLQRNFNPSRDFALGHP